MSSGTTDQAMEFQAAARGPHRAGHIQEQANDQRVRLLLLLDQALFRASLGRFLASKPGFEVAGECGTPAEALQILGSSTIDVVLLELAFGADRANDFISPAREAGYRGRFLTVTESADASNLALLRLGVAGIFLKSDDPDRLAQAIRVVAAGGAFVDSTIIQLLADGRFSSSRDMSRKIPGLLEEREQKVIVGILGGLANRKIASGMGISESSVKNILHGLFKRTGVRTRSQLVRWALEGPMGNELVQKARG